MTKGWFEWFDSIFEWQKKILLKYRKCLITGLESILSKSSLKSVFETWFSYFPCSWRLKKTHIRVADMWCTISMTIPFSMSGLNYLEGVRIPAFMGCLTTILRNGPYMELECDVLLYNSVTGWNFISRSIVQYRRDFNYMRLVEGRYAITFQLDI